MNDRVRAEGSAARAKDASATLPDRLPDAGLEVPERDPFLLPPPPPPPVSIAAVAPPPPPAPTAPPLAYRFLGQLTDPQGQRKVFLAKADKDVQVEMGTQLEEGYVVEAITADEIRLLYPPLQQRAVIRIPVPSNPR